MLRPPPDLQKLQLSSGPSTRGTECFIAGHALLNPASGFAPLLTRGNVSQVWQAFVNSISKWCTF